MDEIKEFMLLRMIIITGTDESSVEIIFTFSSADMGMRIVGIVGLCYN